MTLKEWMILASKGTSGDMVWDILADWEKDLRDVKTCPHCGKRIED